MSKRTMKAALALAAAGVLTLTGVAGTGTAYGDTGQLPAVESSTLAGAISACNDTYNGVAPDTYIDCVNAAYAHFLGRGFHSKLWNT